jgi:hypothetical protein
MKTYKSLTALLFVLCTLFGNLPANASSHREAPFITEMPKSDGTDFYIFTSYESGRENFVTFIANYIPLQDGYGGPNFYTLDPEAVYEIHVDNNGDAIEDLTFQFKAMNTLKDVTLNIGGTKVSVPFRAVGAVGPNIKDNASQNEIETYTLKVISGDRRKGKTETVTNTDTNETTFVKPLDNAGNKTIPDYETYAKKHVYNINIPGCDTPGKVFVGQRKEPFYLDLGGAFDLVNYNPLGPETGGPNQIEEKNITTFALEVLKSCLVKDDPVIGSWTTSSLPKSRVFARVPTFERPALEKGPLVQVSRLSAPLVNELVIGLKDKNRFNFSHPKDDSQFAIYVTNPTLPAILELLFSGAGYKAPTAIPRNDLVSIFLTGVDGLNKPKNVSPAEMMRLNTSTPAQAASSQKNLGVIGGDNTGFPNGRRPGDDVVDIALRAVSGVLLEEKDAPAGKLPITDGVSKDATDFDQVFPYIKAPLPGKKS